MEALLEGGPRREVLRRLEEDPEGPAVENFLPPRDAFHVPASRTYARTTRDNTHVAIWIHAVHWNSIFGCSGPRLTLTSTVSGPELENFQHAIDAMRIQNICFF